MYRSIMGENSPHWVVALKLPATRLCLSWSNVLDELVEFEATGHSSRLLPPEVQRRGAAGALAVGLAVAQLGLLRDDVRCWGWPQPADDSWQD